MRNPVKREERNAWIVQMHEKGRKFSSLARELDISPARVRQIYGRKKIFAAQHQGPLEVDSQLVTLLHLQAITRRLYLLLEPDWNTDSKRTHES